MRAALRLGALLALLAAGGARAEGASPVEVALRHLDALEAPLDAAAFAEERATARTALEVAGEAALPRVAERLRAGGTRCTIAAWALGASESSVSSDAIVALRRALAAGDWDCRVGAGSALGRLGVTDATADLVRALHDATRPPDSDPVLLLAIAGAGGREGDADLRELLFRGGDAAWSSLALAVLLRRGADAGPWMVEAACSGWDGSVRATGALGLMLLADPARSCELAECAGSEPDPGVRRLDYQAIAAGGSPAGRAFLSFVATREGDASLRESARALADLPTEAPSNVSRRRVTSSDVRDALAQLARSDQPPQVLDVVAAGAASVDVAAIDRALRLLPLREDRAWFEDHAKLAQIRARLLCSADPDCEPVKSRVVRSR